MNYQSRIFQGRWNQRYQYDIRWHCLTDGQTHGCKAGAEIKIGSCQAPQRGCGLVRVSVGWGRMQAVTRERLIKEHPRGRGSTGKPRSSMWLLSSQHGLFPWHLLLVPTRENFHCVTLQCLWIVAWICTPDSYVLGLAWSTCTLLSLGRTVSGWTARTATAQEES